MSLPLQQMASSGRLPLVCSAFSVPVHRHLRPISCHLPTHVRCRQRSRHAVSLYLDLTGVILFVLEDYVLKHCLDIF